MDSYKDHEETGLTRGESEQRLIRAFNAGYVLSMYEPRLLEKVIDRNKNNEFVKIMKAARDQQEISRGIPRKEFTPQFKNGYHNARALCEREPKLIEQLIQSKKMNKDYIKGLVSGKKAFEFGQIQQRVKQQALPAPGKKSYTNGFNIGYKLAQHQPEAIKSALSANVTQIGYLQGMKAGYDQFEKDNPVSKARSKSPEQIQSLPEKTRLVGERAEKAKELPVKAEQLSIDQKSGHVEAPKEYVAELKDPGQTELPVKTAEMSIDAPEGVNTTERDIQDIEPQKDE